MDPHIPAARKRHLRNIRVTSHDECTAVKREGGELRIALGLPACDVRCAMSALKKIPASHHCSVFRCFVNLGTECGLRCSQRLGVVHASVRLKQRSTSSTPSYATCQPTAHARRRPANHACPQGLPIGRSSVMQSFPDVLQRANIVPRSPEALVGPRTRAPDETLIAVYERMACQFPEDDILASQVVQIAVHAGAHKHYLDAAQRSDI
ncbi:hypothetical protein FB567DRAFT_288621 [Paraphoma chrysanthemicola]|uniref:Uncharacterized protein n=1 Tax=Paraphoma chrysanthemicola TaxID=798071 RepID=A0A8K0W0F4_9PLEO|nr:hypothetical protein FB567DRAFT_288621 [Paraphoma chrysanthemicola]